MRKTCVCIFHSEIITRKAAILFHANKNRTIDNDIYLDIYFCWAVTAMETAKIFENGGSQAVRLRKKFRFNVGEVIVQQLGEAVLLVPKESPWQTFMDGLEGFTSDIFEDGCDQGIQGERECL